MGGESVLLAQYTHPEPTEFIRLRQFPHCVAEYNCHLVCTPLGHVGAIDPAHAEGLLQHVRHIAAHRDFDVISLAVLSDHRAHFRETQLGAGAGWKGDVWSVLSDGRDC